LNFTHINIRFQKVLVILVCSILIGSGVSVSNYLSNNNAKESFKITLIDECENLGSQAQKYSTKALSGFTNWKLPPASDKSYSINHSIVMNTKDSLMIHSSPKVSQNNFNAVETLVTKDHIIISVIK